MNVLESVLSQVPSYSSFLLSRGFALTALQCQAPSVLALGPTPRNTHPQRRRSLKLFSCRRTSMQARYPDSTATTMVTASPPARLETPEPLCIPWSNPAPIIPTLIDKRTMARAELSCASRWSPSEQKRGTASSVLWPPIAADVNLKDRCAAVRTY